MAEMVLPVRAVEQPLPAREVEQPLALVLWQPALSADDIANRRLEPPKLLVQTPSPVTVEARVQRRTRMSTVQWATDTLEMAQNWPVLLLAVRKREHQLVLESRKRIRLAA
jgi:hypothetical protein